MINPALYSSENDSWETPPELFAALDAEFHFTLDVAADAKNAKCKKYIDEEMDGLKQPWSGVSFCNPPYGRDVDKWVAKAVRETLNGVTTVMLLPARTDVQWFHKYIYNRFETRFIRGRLKFVGAGSSAPFPSMIVVFPGIDLP